jgi:peptide/nickel transport system substrate-binding protein
MGRITSILPTTTRHVATATIRQRGPVGAAGPRLEELRSAWFDAPGIEAQRKVCQQMQLQCMIDAPSLPLGQFVQPTAYRNRLTGVLIGFTTFWNVRPV